MFVLSENRKTKCLPASFGRNKFKNICREGLECHENQCEERDYVTSKNVSIC